MNDEVGAARLLMLSSLARSDSPRPLRPDDDNNKATQVGLQTQDMK